MLPNITVVIPNFNRKELIEKTIKSIQSQSSNNWKCIIVDDGSDEDTLISINNYILNDSRFELISRDRLPKGANTCRNIGLSNVKSDWVMFFDSDDLLLPNTIEERSNAIKSNEEFDFLLFQGVTFSGNEVMNFRNNPKCTNYLIEILKFNISLSTPCALWKTSSLKKIHGWNERFKRWQDPELFIRAFQNKLKYKWINEYPDHLIRLDHQQSKITNPEEAYQDFEEFTSNLCSVYKKLSNKSKLVFSNSIYFYCLKSSYYIDIKQTKNILKLVQENSIFFDMKYLRLRILMTLNVNLRNIKFLKGILHQLIFLESKNDIPNKIYKDDELIKKFKNEIKISNLL